MIDTDKYEGHTEGPWESWSDYIMQKGNSWQEPIAEMDFNFKEADAQLIADAPLLLEEVKRLRGIIAGIVTDMDEDWRFWRSELKKVIE